MQPGHIYDPKPRAVTSIAHREVRSIVEEHSRESDAGLILLVHGDSGGMCRAPGG
jgi:hypothetical protein